MLDNGYDTNYAASWFLVRSESLLDENGNAKPRDNSCFTSLAAREKIRHRNFTRGPLTTRLLDSSKTPANTVPMLCDASASSLLSSDIGDLLGGSGCATPIVGGPVLHRLQIDTSGDGNPDTDITSASHLAASSRALLATPEFPSPTPRAGVTGWLKTWSYDTRQDYRGMSTHHSGVCHVLMADGSVQGIVDSNDDGFINNGFPATPSFWTDANNEAPDLILASYYSLNSKGE
jgi:prepilin-type processing-associated H-X9-DG protein